MKCASCVTGVDHCHGTLVVHPDGGFAECTDARCADDDHLRHSLIVACSGLDGECMCVPLLEQVLRKAS